MLPSLKQQYGVVEERLFCLLHKCKLIDHLFQIQCQVIIHGLLQNRQLAPKAAIAYFETGNLASARQLFDQILQPGTVLWNVMLKGYTEAGLHKDTLLLFSQMKRRDLEEHDVILWDIMISAYVELGDMTAAKELFSRMPVRDVKSWNTILLGYAIGADIGACERFFAIMPDRNVFSWNGLIGGYARHGKFSDVLNVFHRMLISTNIKPNDAMLMVVLSSCSKLGALNWGRWIHLYSENNGFRENVYIGNGLIDMYAKCGCIHSAINVFTTMGKRDVITWNSMINGLAMHGMGLEALELFDHMLDATEEPDGITFVGVLSSCVHMGLVERGFACFKSMKQIYSIDPWIEHYGCMVDLLGRAGLLYEAIGFVMEMPMEPDDVIWSALLGVCRAWNNVYLAEIAMSRLVRLMPEDVVNYVVLSNIYGNAGRWEDFGRLHKVLRRMGVGKLPGSSLVEVNMEVVEFCSSDARHARSKDIYEILESLMDSSRVVIVESELDELCEVNFVKSGREDFVIISLKASFSRSRATRRPASIKETLLLFSQMKRRDVSSNIFTFSFVIMSCSMITTSTVGHQLHCFALKIGLRSNIFVGTAIFDVGIYPLLSLSKEVHGGVTNPSVEFYRKNCSPAFIHTNRSSRARATLPRTAPSDLCSACAPRGYPMPLALSGLSAQPCPVLHDSACMSVSRTSTCGITHLGLLACLLRLTSDRTQPAQGLAPVSNTLLILACMAPAGCFGLPALQCDSPRPERQNVPNSSAHSLVRPRLPQPLLALLLLLRFTWHKALLTEHPESALCLRAHLLRLEPRVNEVDWPQATQANPVHKFKATSPPLFLSLDKNTFLRLHLALIPLTII
ncbi:hypothetical protein M5K25_012384 [Dendrobium thyrsiflorum]|uniref:Pentatricopeptide repeat-containing protein n=1 Tax=Dendrobium thyrsiflorum TaxID=117978 RepID=A0ABD0UWV9_DENTH